MPTRCDHLLICSISARSLAQSAVRGGWRPLVIDVFADQDTRAAATQVRQVPLAGFVFDEQALSSVVETLPPSRLIYGAGLESNPDLLTTISSRHRLCGNAPKVLRRVRSPRPFFDLLTDLNIPHPEVSHAPPRDAEDWLLKDLSGSGGLHVRPWDGKAEPGACGYFQRRLHGQAMSTLFIADGSKSKLIGVNTLRAPLAGSFAYTGGISRASSPQHAHGQIVDTIDKLTSSLGLRGLNGLDFICEDDEIFVLELNPRPTATCELYDPDTEGGLVALHLHACTGELPRSDCFRHGDVRGHAIVYAPSPVCIRKGFQWPVWCRDIPVQGAKIVTGEPICSLHAEDRDSRTVEMLLHTREQEILSALGMVRRSA